MSKTKLQLASSRHGYRPQLTVRHKGRSKVIAVVLLVAALLHFTVISRANREALSAKYSPTKYHNLSKIQNDSLVGELWRWNSADAPRAPTPGYSRQRLLEKRREWRPLGSGFEGDVFIHEDVVIKAYRSANAPFRNCVPGLDRELRWPTEIPASLVLGGLSAKAAVGENDTYVPVVDYFLAPVDSEEHMKWHFVTPFLSSGHLKHLAKRIRKSEGKHSARELDMLFRPSFERILDALGEMHTVHDLCHDDIKPDNIFLATPPDETTKTNETTHWLLADMGNVREIDHPYHRSIIWSRSNLPDCRANDAYRLVKSYIKFLRRAVSDQHAFNAEFLAGEEAWSRLFWATYHDVQDRHPVSAARLKARSQSLDFVPGSPSRPSGLNGWSAKLKDPVTWSLVGKERMSEKEVKSKLFIGATEIPARLWGLSPILGIPVPDCKT